MSVICDVTPHLRFEAVPNDREDDTTRRDALSGRLNLSLRSS